MTTTTTAVSTERTATREARDGFAQLVRSEWTKLRTVRGWIIGMVVAVLLTIALGVLTASGGTIGCGGPGPSNQRTGAACRITPPIGPDGEAVSDTFEFVHQSLSGNGSLTARVTSLTGLYAPGGVLHVEPGAAVTPEAAGMVSGTQPWSKAGIIIKQSETPGSAYAAMMATGGNGVRMQYNYTHDTAGTPGAVSSSSPRWLRLVRSGDTITGYDSVDGTHWVAVDSVTLPGLPSTVQVGLFATSPQYMIVNQSFGGSTAAGGPTIATGTFDDVAVQGSSSGGWADDTIGASKVRALGVTSPFTQSGSNFTVTGSGDIAPMSGDRGSGQPVEQGLVGAFAGLIAIGVVAAMFITAEYRRGLIRLTLAASPRRGRVLAAKAVVIGGVMFLVGLVAAAVSLPVANHIYYNHGAYILPTSSLTELRVIVGTAALFGAVAVFALAVGTLLRRSAATVTVVIVAIVLPYILAVASVLPAGASEWLLRLTPAAAFAVQQTLVAYPQVTAGYTPDRGYFPLSPWAGFAVLCGYALLALGLAHLRLNRRDA
jgi:ABC-type transport system involved in multi-copper enzyme maturation permease subunit